VWLIGQFFKSNYLCIKQGGFCRSGQEGSDEDSKRNGSLLTALVVMDVVGVLITFMLYPFRFIIGLCKIWLENGRRKTFGQILTESETREIVSHGTISILNLIAGIGAIMMMIFVIMVIVGIFKNGLSHA
jgi:flagellar biosynthesis protein FlhB